MTENCSGLTASDIAAAAADAPVAGRPLGDALYHVITHQPVETHESLALAFADVSSYLVQVIETDLLLEALGNEQAKGRVDAVEMITSALIRAAHAALTDAHDTFGDDTPTSGSKDNSTPQAISDLLEAFLGGAGEGVPE